MHLIDYVQRKFKPGDFEHTTFLSIIILKYTQCFKPARYWLILVKHCFLFVLCLQQKDLRWFLIIYWWFLVFNPQEQRNIRKYFSQVFKMLVIYKKSTVTVFVFCVCERDGVRIWFKCVILIPSSLKQHECLILFKESQLSSSQLWEFLFSSMFVFVCAVSLWRRSSAAGRCALRRWRTSWLLWRTASCCPARPSWTSPPCPRSCSVDTPGCPSMRRRGELSPDDQKPSTALKLKSTN